MILPRKQRRSRFEWLGLVPVAVIILIALFVATRHSWFDPLHSPDKALFWTNAAVAFGTIALAMVTAGSVWESREILRQEDVRHQESYGPIVTVEPHFRWGSLDGFYLRNTGLGPAIKMHIRYTGEVRAYEAVVEQRDNKRVLTGEERLVSTTEFSVDSDLDLVIHAPGSRSIDLGQDLNVLVQRAGDNRISFRDILLKYHDVFGNEYATEYPSFTIDGSQPFRWVRPTIKARR